MLDADSARLLAELQAEFGKPTSQRSRGGVPSKQPAPRRVRMPDGRMVLVAAKGEFREPPEGNPQDGANAIAHSATFLDEWQPRQRVTWVMSQSCRCCGGGTAYIAGEYILFTRKPHYAFGKEGDARYASKDKSNAHVWRRADSFPDLWHMDHTLPETVEEREQTVACCVQCLHDSKRVAEIWDTYQRVVAHQPDMEPELPGFEELLK